MDKEFIRENFYCPGLEKLIGSTEFETLFQIDVFSSTKFNFLTRPSDDEIWERMREFQVNLTILQFCMWVEKDNSVYFPKFYIELQHREHGVGSAEHYHHSNSAVYFNSSAIQKDVTFCSVEWISIESYQ
ncbi:MAG TPA: hypothetical protein VGB63_12570, partial [Pedobacter sp.]